MDVPPEQRRLERLTVAGGVLVAIGAVAAVATVVPYVVGSEPLPAAAYLLAMLMPVGFGLLLLGLWGTARSRSRRARSQDDADRPGAPAP
ncbi:MAG TPA: hypothetical protein VK894_02165 [Jiangellales bacterium]|nr:hypothetical protein [Jiangellales bacterium]